MSLEKFRAEYTRQARECAEAPKWDMVMRNATMAYNTIFLSRWMDEYIKGGATGPGPLAPPAWLVFEVMGLDLGMLSTIYVPSEILRTTTFSERLMRGDIEPVKEYADLRERLCHSDDVTAWRTLAIMTKKEILQHRHHGDPSEAYDLAHILPDGTYTSLLPEGYTDEIAFVSTEEIHRFLYGRSIGEG